jgi:hypothetical protein
MTKKSRYFLLAFCTLLFLLIAPYLVLYVRGVDFDWQTGQFVKTGILSVRSEPDNAQIILNDQTVKQGEGDLKFILPGEYSLSVAKPGFQTWTKRLEVLAGQVTWANPAGGKIILFAETPESKPLAADVSDLSLDKGNLFYLSAGKLNSKVIGFGHEQKHLDLKGTFYGLEPDPSGAGVWMKNIKPDGNTGLSYYSLSESRQVDFADNFTPQVRLVFGAQNRPLVLDENRVWAMDVTAGTKSLVSENILDLFYYDGFYYLLENSTNSSPRLTVGSSLNQTQVISQLPSARTGRVLVNFNKEVFLLLDDRLYKLETEPKFLAQNIKNLKLSPDNKTLWIVYGNELGYIFGGSDNLNFVTRSNFPLENAVLLESLGLAIYQKSSSVYAAELDLRDRQNEFLLYQSPALKKFVVSPDAKILWVLDGTELKELKIR